MKRCACACTQAGVPCKKLVYDDRQQYCHVHHYSVWRIRAALIAERRHGVPMARRCCACTRDENGQHCQRPVLETGERYCLDHRNAGLRLRLRRAWRQQEVWATVGTVRWRDMRPLQDEEIWQNTTTIRRWQHRCQYHETIRAVDRLPAGVATRDVITQQYLQDTALFRQGSRLNWPFGRNRPHVRTWLEGVPGR